MTTSTQRKRQVRNVRMSDSEWEYIEAAAELKEVPPSTWLREASIHAAWIELRSQMHTDFAEGCGQRTKQRVGDR